jgi:hypothetical protein
MATLNPPRTTRSVLTKCFNSAPQPALLLGMLLVVTPGLMQALRPDRYVKRGSSAYLLSTGASCFVRVRPCGLDLRAHRGVGGALATIGSTLTTASPAPPAMCCVHCWNSRMAAAVGPGSMPSTAEIVVQVATTPMPESCGAHGGRPACRVDLGYGIRSRILSHLRRHAARRRRPDGGVARLQRHLLR